MSFKKIFFAIIFLFLPIAVFASDRTVFDVAFLSDKIRSIIGLFNLLLALLAAFYAIKLATLAYGGQMERTWNMLALASIIFGLIQVSNSLKGFGVMDIHGVTELFEVLLAFVLVYVFVRTKKMLLK